MLGLQLLPVVLSLLVLGAHFFRAGHVVMVAVVLALVALLGVRRQWAARALQVALVLGAVEWVRTLVRIAAERVAVGQPMLRLILILGSVALLTASSALVFRTERMRRRYASRESQKSGGP